MGADLVPRRFPGATAIIAGTGPSLSPEVFELCNRARAAGAARIFAANRAHELFDADVIHACNYQFWDLWWPQVQPKAADKWTTRPELDGRYPGLRYIPERWEPGLSRDPSWICAHHGTGPQLLNLAYLYGCTRLLLVGWDMRFRGKVDRHTYERRRYLGEDQITAGHWPQTGPNGELEGLIREVETIRPEDYGIEILNCTPGSALRCFPAAELRDALAPP
jgi:hypothetical protein